MIETAKLRRHGERRRMRKLAMIADRIDVPDEAPDRLEAMLEGLDDGWDGIRGKLIELAGERGEWAGYPLPNEHCELVVEKRHPLYATMNGFKLGEKEPEKDEEFEIINSWSDYERWKIVYVLRVKATGRTQVAVTPKYTSTIRTRMILDTIAASQAWSVAAEFKAMERLKTLVTPAAFRYYVLTGTFMETSKRSGVIYVFRKGRPTIAISTRKFADSIAPLCALCLHPVGYYASTFAGSMVPTDDVIAHLIFMRGDERKFWGKCNQHSLRSPEAGV